MECPHCSESGVYIGLQWIHCQNKECQYYDARYVEKLKAEKDQRFYSSLDEKVEKLILLRGEVADPDDDYPAIP